MREFLLGVALVPTLVAIVWFSVVGGAAQFVEAAGTLESCQFLSVVTGLGCTGKLLDGNKVAGRPITSQRDQGLSADGDDVQDLITSQDDRSDVHHGGHGAFRPTESGPVESCWSR